MRVREIVGIFGLLALAACGSSGPPVDAAPSTAAPTASANPSDLEGVWHTGVVTPDDAKVVLQAAGLGEHAEALFAFMEIGNENVFTLRVSGGIWALYWSKDGGPALETDSGAYTVDGDTVTIRHYEGTDTHRWSVRGETLTITYLSDTITGPVPRGEEAMQRVLYMSSPWTRGTP